jgi:hypothetical protein
MHVDDQEIQERSVAKRSGYLPRSDLRLATFATHSSPWAQISMPRLRKWHQSCAILWSRSRRTCHRSSITGNSIRLRSTDGECDVPNVPAQLSIFPLCSNDHRAVSKPFVDLNSRQGRRGQSEAEKAGDLSPSFEAQGKRSGLSTCFPTASSCHCANFHMRILELCQCDDSSSLSRNEVHACIITRVHSP